MSGGAFSFPRTTKLRRYDYGGTATFHFGGLPSWPAERRRGEPERLIGDRAYDSDPLDAILAERGIEMIAPHRRNRKKKKTQDGRKLRRYKRRWKVERLVAWLTNFRRLVVRYERRAENYLGFVQLGCVIILLRYL
jgi:transposase